MRESKLGLREVKVLFVVGDRRSGSTILGDTFGGIPGFVHVGELRTLWEWGLLRGRLCGCGAPVRDCGFWRSVIDRALEHPRHRRIDPFEVHRWHRRSVRYRHLPRILRLERRWPTDLAVLSCYLGAMSRVYRAVGELAAARVVVDSSKNPADAAVLLGMEAVEPFYVHLVRDPRAVAYSWRRKKFSPGEGRREEMMRLSTITSAKNWVLVNVASEWLRRRVDPSHWMRIRYEEFVADPCAVIERILAMVGEKPSVLPFVDERTVSLKPAHTAGGNPDRFRTGLVTLRLDNEWLAKQPPADRFIAGFVSLPLLVLYGYPIRVRPSD